MAASIFVVAASIVRLRGTAAALLIDPSWIGAGIAHYAGAWRGADPGGPSSCLRLCGLVASAAMKPGALKWIASAFLLVGSFGMGPLRCCSGYTKPPATAFGIVGPDPGRGLILFGMGVMRTHRWTSWRRLAPLAMGLYVPLVMIPIVVLAHGDSLPPLVGYHALQVLVGVAFMMEDRAAAR